ncbi:MAG: TlpA family protein disulfide reductase [Treponema sp.]|nr:TlpA family protein disulfide reductase [Treponema sp.]
MKNLSIIIFGLIFCSFILPVGAQVSPETANLLRGARIQVLPQRQLPQDFTLQNLNGENVTLSSYKGKVVLLNFWATWCPPCRDEMPSMETLYKRYKNQGLELLAVNLRENPAAVRQFIQRGGYTFPIPLDTNGRVSGNYGVEAIPTTYVIDREGMIIGRIVGAIHWDTPQVFAAFDALLK